MEFVGKVKEIPTRTRSGVWRDYFDKEFSKNPGEIYEFKGVSSSTAANLRRDYGLDASTVTVDGVMHLYVVWSPEKADEIKAGYKPKKPKAKKGASNGAGTTAPAPAKASK